MRVSVRALTDALIARSSTPGREKKDQLYRAKRQGARTLFLPQNCRTRRLEGVDPTRPSSRNDKPRPRVNSSRSSPVKLGQPPSCPLSLLPVETTHHSHAHISSQFDVPEGRKSFLLTSDMAGYGMNGETQRLGTSVVGSGEFSTGPIWEKEKEKERKPRLSQSHLCRRW